MKPALVVRPLTRVLDGVQPQVQISGNMKINRLMQVVFVSGAVTVAVPAFAAWPANAEAPSALCGGDSDSDEDEDEGEEGVALCGGDSDDGDEDEGGEETSLL